MHKSSAPQSIARDDPDLQKKTTGPAQPLHRDKKKQDDESLVRSLENSNRELVQRIDELQRKFQTLTAEALQFVDRFYRAPAGYVVLDEQGGIVDCNPCFAAILAATPFQLRNTPLVDHIGIQFREKYKALMGSTRSIGTPQGCFVDFLCKNKQAIHAHLTISHRNCNPGFIGGEYRAIIIDTPLRIETTIDPMTGVLNRHEGFMTLEAAIAQSHAENKPVTICLVDLNNLKHVNDHFGHFEGDEVIVQSARIITGHIKKTDIVFRLGGDAFLIIFKKCTMELAEMIVDRVEGERGKYNAESGKPYNIGWCYGIEEWDEQTNDTVEDLIRKADEKMLRQKKEYQLLRSEDTSNEISDVSSEKTVS
jgi:diguanylate cyclase (GGDEF)-like protein